VIRKESLFIFMASSFLNPRAVVLRVGLGATALVVGDKNLRPDSQAHVPQRVPPGRPTLSILNCDI
jgi:hypothetical protein